jgi:hypothetical protein
MSSIGHMFKRFVYDMGPLGTSRTRAGDEHDGCGILTGNVMAIGKGKPNAGQGGRLGRSNMAYWGTNAEAKAEARKRRRQAGRNAVAEGVADLNVGDRVIRRRRVRA